MKEFSVINRSEILLKAQEIEYDLIVIGGGVTGAGIALDASNRGLTTLLLEKSDFASGTSSKSTKLIHGGLRYLKQFEIGLVRETGTERAVVHGLAPHLVHPEKMLLPIVENGSFGKWSASIAISVYDYLAGVKPADRKVGLDSEELLAEEPLVKEQGLRGGMKYSEYRTDDARLTISLVQTALREGADAINYCEVLEFIYEEEKVVGVVCHDHIQNLKVALRAKKIVSATGPWVDQLRTLDNSTGGKSLHLTKGVHIVLPHDKLPLKTAVYFDAFDGRMIFAIPRGKVTYVGTSDTTYHGDLDRVLCSQMDANYLLDAVNHYFLVGPLQLDDIVSSWAGLRPLIHEDGKSPSELSRKDEIFQSPSGLISIAGGKLTGYRKMAERIVDLLLSKLGGDKEMPCKTDSISLHPEPYHDYDEVLQHIEILAQSMIEKGLLHYNAWYLVTTYGRTADQIWDTAKESKHTDLDEALFLAELEHSFAFEGICNLLDFFNRRTGRMYFDMDSVHEYHELALSFMADRLGWGDQRTEQERTKIHEIVADCLHFNEVAG